MAEEGEERYFLNPDVVSRHMYCIVCQEVYKKPQRAPCGHSFCHECITKWLKRSKTCPSDRSALKPAQLHHDFILENIIGDQMVACSFRKRGCSHICQLSNLKLHKMDCEFNPDNLPAFLRTDPKPAKRLRDTNKPAKDLSNKTPGLSSDSDNDESQELESGVLPSLGRPSLKMRLFQAGGTKKRLLMEMFDARTANQENVEPVNDFGQSPTRPSSSKTQQINAQKTDDTDYSSGNSSGNHDSPVSSSASETTVSATAVLRPGSSANTSPPVHDFFRRRSTRRRHGSRVYTID